MEINRSAVYILKLVYLNYSELNVCKINNQKIYTTLQINCLAICLKFSFRPQ